jgi:hypothetical protein
MLQVPAATLQISALASSLRLIPQWHAFPGPEEEGDGTCDSDTVSQGYFNDPKATAGQHLFSSRVWQGVSGGRIASHACQPCAARLDPELTAHFMQHR